MATLKVCLTWASVALGIASAACWWRSATVKVPHGGGPTAQGGYADGTFAVDGADLVKTMRAQTEWNKWSAFAAAGAVGTQAIAQVLPD